MKMSEFHEENPAIQSNTPSPPNTPSSPHHNTIFTEHFSPSPSRSNSPFLCFSTAIDDEGKPFSNFDPFSPMLAHCDCVSHPHLNVTLEDVVAETEAWHVSNPQLHCDWEGLFDPFDPLHQNASTVQADSGYGSPGRFSISSLFSRRSRSDSRDSVSSAFGRQDKPASRKLSKVRARATSQPEEADYQGSIPEESIHAPNESTRTLWMATSTAECSPSTSQLIPIEARSSIHAPSECGNKVLPVWSTSSKQSIRAPMPSLPSASSLTSTSPTTYHSDRDPSPIPPIDWQISNTTLYELECVPPITSLNRTQEPIVAVNDDDLSNPPFQPFNMMFTIPRYYSGAETLQRMLGSDGKDWQQKSQHNPSSGPDVSNKNPFRMDKCKELPRKSSFRKKLRSLSTRT